MISTLDGTTCPDIRGDHVCIGNGYQGSEAHPQLKNWSEWRLGTELQRTDSRLKSVFLGKYYWALEKIQQRRTERKGRKRGNI